MKIRYILVTQNSETPGDSQVQGLIGPNYLEDQDMVHCIFQKEEESLESILNDSFDEFDLDNWTHVCILSSTTTLTLNYRELIEPYVNAYPEAVLLPIVDLRNLPVAQEEPQFKGFINTCVWKPYYTAELGEMTLELAKKQIDTTLYGALIPVKVVKENKLKTKIKYYSFFEYLTRLANKEIEIRGVPKRLVTCIMDIVLGSVSQEEKIKYFKACQKVYESDEDVEIIDEETTTTTIAT